MAHHINDLKKIQNDLIEELTSKLEIYFGKNKSSELSTSLKSDQSIVSEIDQFVSDHLKSKLFHHNHYKNWSFFSEEDFKSLNFPTAVLDPIDGTRELVLGRAECVVALALMNSSAIDDPLNYGWLYNPFSGFSLDSTHKFVQTANKSKQKFLGMVSRSEYEKGFFNHLLNFDQKIEISPRGSIAFKLGLLASGGCDFVLSLSDKNIWDIAAGTILCHQRNIFLYQDGKKVEDLNSMRIKGPMLWAPENLAEELIEKFNNEKAIFKKT
jgi:myo-inositol-1(or 4)-monophosphatase